MKKNACTGKRSVDKRTVQYNARWEPLGQINLIEYLSDACINSAMQLLIEKLVFLLNKA